MVAEVELGHLALIDKALCETDTRMTSYRTELVALERQRERIVQLREFEAHKSAILGELGVAARLRQVVEEAQSKLTPLAIDITWYTNLAKDLDSKVTSIREKVPSGIPAVSADLRKVLREDELEIKKEDVLSSLGISLTDPKSGTSTKAKPMSAPVVSARLSRPKKSEDDESPSEDHEKLSGWFSHIKGDSVKVDSPYYLPDVKTGVFLPQDFINSLGMTAQPPFSEINYDASSKSYGVKLNREALPYAEDLSRSERYRQARELSLSGVAGFLEMAAAIGKDPDDQSALAREMLMWITRHHQGTSLNTLKKWRETLNRSVGGHTALEVFKGIEKRLKGRGIDEKDACLVSLSELEFDRVWNERLERLKRKAENNEQFTAADLAQAQFVGLSVNLKKAFFRYQQEVEKATLSPEVEEKKEQLRQAQERLRRSLGWKGSLRFLGSRIPGLNRWFKPEDDPVLKWQQARQEYLRARQKHLVDRVLTNVERSVDAGKLPEEEYRRLLSDVLHRRLTDNEQATTQEEVRLFEELHQRILESHRHWKRSLAQGIGLSAGVGLFLHFANPAPIVGLGIQAARLGVTAVKLEPTVHAAEIRIARNQAMQVIPEEEIQALNLDDKMKKYAKIHAARIQQALIGEVPSTTITEHLLRDSIYNEARSRVMAVLAGESVTYDTPRDKKWQILFDQLHIESLDKLEGYKAEELKTGFSVPRRLARYGVAALASLGTAWVIDSLIQAFAPQVTGLINELKGPSRPATVNLPSTSPAPIPPPTPQTPVIPISGEMTFDNPDTYYQHLIGNGNISSVKGAVEEAWMQRHNLTPNTLANFTQFHLMADNNPAFQRQLGAGELAFHTLNSSSDFLSTNPDFLLHTDAQGSLIHYKEPDWGVVFAQAA